MKEDLPLRDRLVAGGALLLLLALLVATVTGGSEEQWVREDARIGDIGGLFQPRAPSPFPGPGGCDRCGPSSPT